MPMTVRVTIPTLTLTPEPSVMREVGDLAVRMIRDRTAQGKSSEGGSFAPLSPGYAKRKRAELGHDRADLTVSGRMLNDLAVIEQGPSIVTLGFRSRGGRGTGQTLIQRSRAVGAEDKAFWHHVSGAGRSRVRRPFFALMPNEVAVIHDRVTRWLRTLVDRVNRG